MYDRNVSANVLQSMIGTTLFSTQSNRSLHSLMSRIGVSIAYTTTTTRLRLLGKSARAKVLEIGREVVAGTKFVHILFDNVNQYRAGWNPSFGSKASLESGTASTLIIQHSVPPGAYHHKSYYARPKESPLIAITAERVFDEVPFTLLEE